MWMSGHPGNRRQWKAEMMTAATHLACVARSQSMGNGIPGLQKRKKRIMKMVLFYTLHTTKRRRNMKKQGFGKTKDGKEALLYMRPTEAILEPPSEETETVSREQHLNCTEKHTSWQKMRTTTTCTAARTDTITASGT